METVNTNVVFMEKSKVPIFVKGFFFKFCLIHKIIVNRLFYLNSKSDMFSVNSFINGTPVSIIDK